MEANPKDTIRKEVLLEKLRMMKESRFQIKSIIQKSRKIQKQAKQKTSPIKEILLSSRILKIREKKFNLVSKSKMNDMISELHSRIMSNDDSTIVLLRNRDVIHWIFGDLSFLNYDRTDIKDQKMKEDRWGKEIVKNMLNKEIKVQWTTKFGECVHSEILTLLGRKVSIPQKKLTTDGVMVKPDLEDETFIWEVKTQTYSTGGTASEKIYGAPLKYLEVPEIYNKPLRIVMYGNAETICHKQFQIIDSSHQLRKYSEKNQTIFSVKKQKYLKHFKEDGIEFIGGTELMYELLNVCQK